MRNLLASLVVMCMLTHSGFVLAEEPVSVQVVAEGLDNPCGVAIQPETGHVFVSESAAGRVLRFVDGQPQPAIVGFPQDEYGPGPKYKIGPLGLSFLDKQTLVVGGGGLPDDQELLRVYTIPEPGGEPRNVQDMKVHFSLPAADGAPAEGNFHGVAAGPDGIYVTCNGDDTKGWIAKADVKGTKIGPLRRFIATRPIVDVDAPVAITISPDGFVVVGQMGEITQPGDGLLTFYRADGQPLLNLATGLSDTTGLAYSPKTGLLYAVDFSWHDTSKGGLFRLDREFQGARQAVKAVRIADLDKPTAMAFAADGTLYVTALGTAADADAPVKPGRLLRIAPGL